MNHHRFFAAASSDIGNMGTGYFISGIFRLPAEAGSIVSILKLGFLYLSLFK
jgi:hypothetical protein